MWVCSLVADLKPLYEDGTGNMLSSLVDPDASTEHISLSIFAVNFAEIEAASEVTLCFSRSLEHDNSHLVAFCLVMFPWVADAAILRSSHWETICFQ